MSIDDVKHKVLTFSGLYADVEKIQAVLDDGYLNVGNIATSNGVNLLLFEKYTPAKESFDEVFKGILRDSGEEPEAGAVEETPKKKRGRKKKEVVEAVVSDEATPAIDGTV